MLQALAADITLINTSLPGGIVNPGSGIAGMIAQAYQYLVSIAGGIAFLVIVYAGIQWAMSQGNSGKISDAKDRIWQALYGILILFGAYLLLSMVNPSLTYLKMPELQTISLPNTPQQGQLPSDLKQVPDSQCQNKCLINEVCVTQTTASSTAFCRQKPTAAENPTSPPKMIPCGGVVCAENLCNKDLDTCGASNTPPPAGTVSCGIDPFSKRTVYCPPGKCYTNPNTQGLSCSN